MSMIRPLLRAAGAFALAGVALSCDHEADVLIPEPADDMFRSYVAIGNSITAGYQSDGIDSTSQSQSYAVLLARQMGTRFAFPALATPGCPPRIINWQTGARTASGTSTTCGLRNPNLATDILNNVAVPGAASTEVNAQTSAFHNTLTTLFLGGKTQVQRALEASPTFVSIWIGNNDVLQAAVTGLLNPTPNVSRGITPLATFTARYNAMTDSLEQFAPDASGVLIGVVQTANAPILFQVGILLTNAAYRAGFDQAAGFNPASSDPFKRTPLTIDASCSAAPTTLVSFAIVPQIAAFRNDSTQPDPTRRRGHPPVIQCGSTAPEGPTPGHIFILTPAEQTTLRDAIAAYNAHIQTKATELDFAYYDPNDLLSMERQPGRCVAVVPDLTAHQTTGAPFGTCISFDGVHPSAAGHRLIANALIGAINTKYVKTVPLVP
jgi:lysophospholipase L1-like esterase